MAEYLTVKGQSYSVTANSNTTVTDSTGLSLSVEAGGQAQFIACADKVEVEGDCSIVQCRLGSVGSSTRSGGGGVDPSNFVSKDEFAEFQESNEQALEGKQDKLTLQTTLADNSDQVPTGAAVYKALGNRTALTFDSALSTTSTNPIQNNTVTTALNSCATKDELDSYATKDELEDATSIEQETLHDSAWADDITPFASGDYLSATANKDLLGVPLPNSADLHFQLTDSPGIAVGENIHAIKVPLSGSGTGMRLFLPLSKISLADRNVSAGAISIASTLYLSSDPLTEEDYARGYAYLYPRGFSASVNALLVESSLNFGAGADESNVYFGVSPGPTIPFKTFHDLKVNRNLTEGSCLCVTVNILLKDYVGTPIGVVYMEKAPIKDAVANNTTSIANNTTAIANNTTAIAAAQAKDVEQDGRLDALEAGGGGGGGGGSTAYQCWIVMAFGGTDVISCSDYRDNLLVGIRRCAYSGFTADYDVMRMKFSRPVTIEELHDYFKTAPLCMGGMYPAGADCGYVPLAPYIEPEGTEW